jgi:thymidylate synthase
MHTHMRSNDAFFGLPHDVFTFTMLQEIAARELGFGLGSYTHSVASLHLYHDKAAGEGHPAITSRSGAEAYYREGYHESRSMPEMPAGDPWQDIERVKLAEREIRTGNTDYTAPVDIDPYWKDFIDLFRIYKMFEDMRKRKEDPSTEWAKARQIVGIMNKISPIYQIYIRDKLQRRKSQTPDLFKYFNEA